MMVKPGYNGPFVTNANVVNPKGPRYGVEVTMRDEGHNNRIIATASASFHLVGR
jgi:hypothetical protein